jgi:beta-galactosidase
MSRIGTAIAGICALAAMLSPVMPASAGESVVRLSGDWKREGHGQSLMQTLSLASEITSFGLNYDITIPEGTPEGKCISRQWVFTTKVVPLGMNSPASANWYYQGFFQLRVDDLSLHELPGHFRMVRSGGADGLLEGTWATPKGPVYLRFDIRGGDDKLLMQVALGPETKAEKVELTLLAYPQGFDKPWERRMSTGTRDVASAYNLTLDPAQERWALYYDDRMRREKVGAGPCGLVYVPDEVEPVKVDLGPYNVNTRLATRPGSRRITLALWDFTSIGDADRMRGYLRRDGAAITEDVAALAAVDWSKTALPAPRLSHAYADFLAGIAKEQLRPTAYDQMTGEVVTPHLRWGKPLPGGPVRVLAVMPRWRQRETVELAQRLDLDLATLSFCTPENLIEAESLYLYGSYELYGYRRKTEAAVLTDLAAKLQMPQDVMILSSFQPEILSDSLRARLADKVRGGTGLIVLGAATRLLSDFQGQLQPAAWDANVVPISRLPVFDRMVSRKQPVYTAYTLGKGRVLVFHYQTGSGASRQGLTPQFGLEDPDVLGYYDYYHSLLGAGVLWAAGKELPVRLRLSSATEATIDASQAVPEATLEVLVDDPSRRIRESSRIAVNLPQGTSAQKLPSLGPAAGPRYTSVWVKKGDQVLGWSTGYADLPADPRIATIDLNDKTAQPGGKVSGTVRLSGLPAKSTVDLELWDSRGRMLVRQQVRPTGPEVPFQFTLPPTVAILHEVRVRLLDGQRLVDQDVEEFSVPDPSVDDFHFLAWIDGGNNPITQAILGVLADGGVDWIDNTGVTGATEASARAMLRNAARYDLRSIPYITRINADQLTGRVRQPCLTDPAYRAKWTAELRQRAKGASRFGPPAYTLGDENYLVSRAPLDVCISPTCLAGFREWLQHRYGTLARLNMAWKTQWNAWQDVAPSTFDEVRATPDHWPRWADHRLYMNQVFTEAHALGREAIRSVDPQARVGFDGLFSLDSWHGYDFYQLCRACDLVEVYAGHTPSQIEYLRCWRQPGAVVGAWYNEVGNRDEIAAKRLGWLLLFHQFNSSWYWMAYDTGPALLLPDLRPSPQFQWMQAAHAEIRGGIGKLLLAAQRQHDGIAIHYSQASVHAGTLFGRAGDSGPLSGFASLVEDLGLQYDVLSYEQIEKGKLKDYKILLMPACTALSPAEVEAVRQFVEGGGLVVADTVPGMLDEHCRLLETGQLDGLLGIARTGLPDRKSASPLVVDMGASGTGGVSRSADAGASGPDNALKTELPLTVYDAALKAAGAKPWAAAGATPAVLVRQVGKGWTVLLNTAVEQYTGVRKTRQGRTTQDLLRRVLGLLKLQPEVRVTSGGVDLDACEVVRFADGPIQYVCLLTDHAVAGVKAEDVVIQLPLTANVYDVRARQSLGKRKTLEARLLPGDPKVYALLPYSLEGLDVKPAVDRLPAGAAAAFDVTIRINAERPVGRHCLRIEVLGPDGRLRGHYGQNVLTEKLTTRVAIPLALNDAVGRWQLRVTDVATGQTTTSSFVVEPGR